MLVNVACVFWKRNRFYFCGDIHACIQHYQIFNDVLKDTVCGQMLEKC